MAERGVFVDGLGRAVSRVITRELKSSKSGQGAIDIAPGTAFRAALDTFMFNVDSDLVLGAREDPIVERDPVVDRGLDFLEIGRVLYIIDDGSTLKRLAQAVRRVDPIWSPVNISGKISNAWSKEGAIWSTSLIEQLKRGVRSATTGIEIRALASELTDLVEPGNVIGAQLRMA